MDKHAQLGKQVMIFPFLFLIVIIGGGIALGVSIYFGTGYDIRQADANILSYKIENCLAANPISEIENDFYVTCGLDENAIEGNRIIFRICENSNTEDCIKDNANPILSSGSNFQACVFSGARQNIAFPECKSSQIMKDGRSFIIVAGSNQQIKRVNG